MTEHVVELLALYALGGLEAAELETVANHLAVCASCRAEAERLSALVGTLAASVPPRAPDPRLRALVLKRAGINAKEPARAAPPERPYRERSIRARLPAWLAVGATIALVGLLGWNIYLTRQVVSLRTQVEYTRNAVALVSSPTTQQIALLAQGGSATAGGSAYIDQQSHDVVLIIKHLDPLPSDKTYQAWIITDQGPQNAGLLQVSETGWGMTWLETPYPAGGAIGVSLEPQGGSPQPTQVVLLGKP